MNLGEGIGLQCKKSTDTCNSGFAITTGDNVKLMFVAGSQMIDDLGTCHLKTVDFNSL